MASLDAIRLGAALDSTKGGSGEVVAVSRPRPTPPAVRHVRVAYLDNVKVLLVAVIIVAHGLAGYSWLEDAWPYQSVREARLTVVGDAVLTVPAVPGMLFVMGLFFLISGLVTPGSLQHKGPGRFARDQLVRLGIPLAVWALGIWPALVFAIHRAAGQHGSYWTQFVRADPFLDTGPMWFVEVLLIYSLGYALWGQLRSHRSIPSVARSSSAADGGASTLGRTLVLLATGMSIATILVRPVFPFMSAQIGTLKLWQWPQFLALFGLGIVAAQRGWLAPVPDRTRRRCGIAALLSLAAFAVLTGGVLAAGIDLDVFGDTGLHWAPLAMAAIEGPLAISMAVWLLAAAQRHLDRPPGRRGRALARSSYGAFILQGPVLIGLALALRPVGLPADAKALLVAGAGVAGSFALAWVLVSRTPLRSIL